MPGEPGAALGGQAVLGVSAAERGAGRSAARRGRSLTTDRRRAAPRGTRREGEAGAGRGGPGGRGCRGAPAGAAALKPPCGHRAPFSVRKASKAESIPRCDPTSLCRWVWRRQRRARGDPRGTRTPPGVLPERRPRPFSIANDAAF